VLIEIYESFRRENAVGGNPSTASDVAVVSAPDVVVNGKARTAPTGIKE
jgi:hypothetical protein